MLGVKGFQSMLLGVLLALSFTGAQEAKQSPAKECKTRWLDRDNPSGTGDYELTSQFWDENPEIICPHPVAVEVRTVDGIPASETGQQFSVNDAIHGFACINAQQGKGNMCRDYQVRFTCPDSYCHPGPTSQATSRPETSPPAQTHPTEPEQTPSIKGQNGAPSPQAPLTPETTLPPAQTHHKQTPIAESQKGAPSPQAPLRPETTPPPAQTPHPEPDKTTVDESQKGAPSPQAPLRPETTLPPAQTPHPGAEQTTTAESQKGAPSPQSPLSPEETTLPPAQTPHPGAEQTTMPESQKGAPTPQAPLRPEMTLPPAQTPHPRADQTTIAESRKGVPSPQAPLRPETTLSPAKAPQAEPEQTTISESQKGAPSPQAPLRPETTLPPAQTPCPRTEQTTIVVSQKAAPTPQGPLRPETTLPPAQTPHPEPEQTTTAESQKGVCITRWFDQDDPSGTGDYELFSDIMDKYPNVVCSEPTAIEVQTLDGTPASETGQLFTINDVRVGFFCINALQGKGQRCRDYQVRFTCPPSFCSGGPIQSTSGPEPVTTPAPSPTLKQVKSSPGIPVKGSEIQSTPGPEHDTPPAPAPTREQVQSSPEIPVTGDQDQCGLEPVTLFAPTPASPEVKTGSQVQEQACKTIWFDRDNPSGTGDYELYPDIMDENLDAVCLDPIAVEVQTLDGTPASETGQHFAVNNASQGFACVNAHQGKGVLCFDYRVRFICPDSFCAGKGQPGVEATSAAAISPVPITQVIHQGPTQGQDQSGLEPAASTPVDSVPLQTTAAPTPVDSVPVQTTQQSPAPVCKTKWLNRDNPTATGDYELTYYIKKEHPKAICNKPIAIEVQTVDGIPASQTGQKFARNDPVSGFACINAHQGKGVFCHDYKVRFTCPESFCSGGDHKDPGGMKSSP